jgi:RNA polymerase sigma factor (sigma-70 family)
MQQADDVSASLQRFEVLYKSCYQAIYAYVLRRMAGSQDEVPDIVADVFSVAWRRIDAIPRPPRDRLWLYGVARRTVLDHHRRAARKLRLESLLRTNGGARQGDGPACDPSHLRLRKAVGRLRPLDREALRLVAWDGLSHAEAAEVLGCSANAVALRVHKAKARLKAELAPADPPRPTPVAGTTPPKY